MSDNNDEAKKTQSAGNKKKPSGQNKRYGKGRRPNNRNKNKNSSANGPKKNSEQKAEGAGPRHPQSKKKKSNNKRRRNYNKKPFTKDSPQEVIASKYNNLLEQHLLARKKYFALYFRADNNQKKKLERVYQNTLIKLRDFETNLRPEDKELFNKHFHSLSTDTTYSSNHGLSPERLEVAHLGQFDDPHYLETQKESKYEEDTEESVGSLEDYNAYKGQ